MTGAAAASPNLLSPQGDAELRADEGRRARGYRDTLGNWTCGIGCTGPDIDADTFWSPETIELRFAEAKAETAAWLDRNLDLWRALDPLRRDVVFNMAYQLRGKLLGFQRFLAALQRADYGRAAVEMLDSDWARQCPGRAARLARQMRTGIR